MATATGLTIVKRFRYRGTDEEWSNKYWVEGTPPSQRSEWMLLFEALATAESQVYCPSSTVVAGYGYNDSAEGAHAVFAWDDTMETFECQGKMLPVADRHYAGDQAGFVWWRTDRKNSRGKWIYLRKYFHDGITDADADYLAATTVSAYGVFADLMAAGNWITPARQIRSQKQDENIIAQGTNGAITTRTLKRRGKRP